MDKPDLVLAQKLLEDAVKADPRGKAGVAFKLGRGRALLSRVLSANDTTPLSAKLARRILDVYFVINACPLINNAPRPRAECQAIAQAPAPTHNPNAMTAWKTCQHCPHGRDQRSGIRDQASGIRDQGSVIRKTERRRPC